MGERQDLGLGRFGLMGADSVLRQVAEVVAGLVATCCPEVHLSATTGVLSPHLLMLPSTTASPPAGLSSISCNLNSPVLL